MVAALSVFTHVLMLCSTLAQRKVKPGEKSLILYPKKQCFESCTLFETLIYNLKIVNADYFSSHTPCQKDIHEIQLVTVKKPSL